MADGRHPKRLEDEQPYERLLNDAAEVVGYETDGLVLFGSFLMYFFGGAMLLGAVFGSLWGWVYWVLFALSVVAAIATTASDSFADRYGRKY
jgi:hypothetical protein